MQPLRLYAPPTPFPARSLPRACLRSSVCAWTCALRLGGEGSCARAGRACGRRRASPLCYSSRCEGTQGAALRPPHRRLLPRACHSCACVHGYCACYLLAITHDLPYAVKCDRLCPLCAWSCRVPAGKRAPPHTVNALPPGLSCVPLAHTMTDPVAHGLVFLTYV